MDTFRGFKKGINLGGWISQFEKYDIGHFDSFITKKDIEDIAGMGFDHVRVPVDYNVLEDEDGNPKTSGFRYLDLCREWCEEFKLNMLIDLHECYGYSFDPLKEMDRKKFFFDEALQERFLNLWKKIAERFAAYPEQVAFEPLNEVVLWEVADAWNELLPQYIETIRKIAPDSYIVAGGVCYNNVLSVPLLKIPFDKKLVYNFHCYEPMVFTHQGAYWMDKMPSDFRTGYPKTLEEYRKIQSGLEVDLGEAIFKEDIREIGEGFFEDIFAPALKKSEEDNVPLYCGEFGVIDLAAEDDKKRWLKDIESALDKHGIGHAQWNYKEKDFGII